MKRLCSAINCLSLTGLALVACDIPQSGDLSFEDWRQSQVLSVQGPEPYFIVEGDIIVRSEEELRAIFQGLRSEERTVDEVGVGSQGLAVGGWRMFPSGDWQDAVWGGDQQDFLVYCVDDAFGGRKGEVVQAMNFATREWERSVAVRFLYWPSEDSRCNSRNRQVVFRVRPATQLEEDAANAAASPPFWWIEPIPAPNATAFFPNDTVPNRAVILYSRAFSAPLPRTVPGILRHELGHALGFRHEHPRNPLNGNCTEDNYEARGLTPYDSHSVMTYTQCGDSRSDYSLTPFDIQAAQSIYGTAHLDLVALYAANGRYVVAEGGRNRVLANRTHLGPWETFELVDLGDHYVALRGTGRGFVAAHPDNSVTADEMYISDTAKFRMDFEAGSLRMSLRLYDGRYLTSASDGSLSAGPFSALAWFSTVGLDSNPVAMRSLSGSRWVSATNGGGSDLKATATELWRFETFYRVNLPNGKTAFRTRLGRYVSAQNGGGGAVTADRDVIGTWESFAVEEYIQDRALVRTCNGSYLQVSDGNAVSAAASSWSSPNTDLRITALNGGHVALQAASLQYVSALNGGGYEVRANVPWIAGWETFTRVYLGGDRAAFRCMNGMYLQARGGGGKELGCDADWIGTFETFRVTDLGGDFIALQASNGQYVAAEGGGGDVLNANRTAIGAWERLKQVRRP